jgi:Skp family chaperone for outer membrane proteins
LIIASGSGPSPAPEHTPECYERIVEEFPLAEAQLLRYQDMVREAEEEYAKAIGARADEKDRLRAEKQAERARKKAEKATNKAPGKKRKPKGIEA